MIIICGAGGTDLENLLERPFKTNKKDLLYLVHAKAPLHLYITFYWF